MELSNNGGDNALTRYLTTPSEISSAKNWLYLVESLPKGIS